MTGWQRGFEVTQLVAAKKLSWVALCLTHAVSDLNFEA